MRERESRKTNREMKHTNILKYVFDILFFNENHFECFVTFEEIIHNSLVIRIHTTLFLQTILVKLKLYINIDKALILRIYHDEIPA